MFVGEGCWGRSKKNREILNHAIMYHLMSARRKRKERGKKRREGKGGEKGGGGGGRGGCTMRNCCFYDTIV